MKMDEERRRMMKTNDGMSPSESEEERIRKMREEVTYHLITTRLR